MPAILPNNDQWIARRLQATAAGVAAQAAQRTQYLVDPTSGQCVAIWGDISVDNQGNDTGLDGWGLASIQVPTAGTWTQVA